MLLYTSKKKLETIQMSNTEKKRAELLTFWEMGWKLGLAFAGKDKFRLEHAEFDVLMWPNCDILRQTEMETWCTRGTKTRKKALRLRLDSERIKGAMEITCSNDS